MSASPSDTSTDQQKTLATFLRLARTHKSDLDMLPLLKDLTSYLAEAATRSRINIVRDLIWHHSIAEHAEQQLLDKINEWEAELHKQSNGAKQ